ncbi:MAG: TRAP transporter small permease [Fusobacteriaceae bacterium]
MKKIVEKIIVVMTSIFMTILVLGALWQVFSRYVIGKPSLLTEELLRFSLIWTAMLGAVYCFGEKKHLALTFLKEKMSDKNKEIMDIVNGLLTVIFAAVIMVGGGYRVIMVTISQKSPILNLSMGLVYSIIPFSGILVIAMQGSIIMENFKRLKKVSQRGE